MEKNKYYTPDIEDLHVGYQCEEYHRYLGDNPYWQKAILEIESNDNHGDALMLDGTYRTKYLDQEDIESLGWKCQEYTQNGYNQSYTKDANSESGYDLTYCTAWGEKWQIDYCGSGIFWGEIKSINELRKIMKMVGIK